MRLWTSRVGRFQFSSENAYKVSQGIPISRLALTIARTASAPFSCPRSRLIPFFFAHLPFPSMITATCFGNLS